WWSPDHLTIRPSWVGKFLMFLARSTSRKPNGKRWSLTRPRTLPRPSNLRACVKRCAWWRPWVASWDVRATANPAPKRFGSGCNTLSHSPQCGNSSRIGRTHPRCPAEDMGNDQPLGRGCRASGVFTSRHGAGEGSIACQALCHDRRDLPSDAPILSTSNRHHVIACPCHDDRSNSKNERPMREYH